MRVRFYRVGAPDAIRCDDFPLLLGLEGTAHQLETTSSQPVCRIDDVGGQLLFRDLAVDRSVLVNGEPLVVGPLNPGDHLSVDGLEFVVSYEQTGSAVEADRCYRFATT